MNVFDLHQDLMTHVRFAERLSQAHQTSFDEIVASPVDLVIATAFPFPSDDNQYDPVVSDLITDELELYRVWLRDHHDWRLVLRADDLAVEQQKIILHLEGLNVFDGSAAAWSQLDAWRALGVRSIGTHWNVENQLGGGTLQPDVPLTSLGGQVVEYLEEHNMIFDLAHMGRASFADAVKVSTRPLYVSHGNVDALCPNVRNYTDEQLYSIAETDGLIGVFFVNTFVTGGSRSTIADVIRHIDYLKKLIGVRHIGIGSDWGGVVSRGVDGLETVLQVDALPQALQQHGYNEEEIAQICWQNGDRVLRSHLQ